MQQEQLLKQIKLNLANECEYQFKYYKNKISNWRDYTIYHNVYHFDISSFFLNFMRLCFNYNLDETLEKKEYTRIEGLFIKSLNVEDKKKYILTKRNFRNYIYKKILENSKSAYILELNNDDIYFISNKHYFAFLPKESELQSILKINVYEKIIYLTKNIKIFIDENDNVIETININFHIAKSFYNLIKNKNISKFESQINNINYFEYLQAYKIFYPLLKKNKIL